MKEGGRRYWNLKLCRRYPANWDSAYLRRGLADAYASGVQKRAPWSLQRRTQAISLLAEEKGENGDHDEANNENMGKMGPQGCSVKTTDMAMLPHIATNRILG